MFLGFLQVSIATVCVRRDAGDPTAPTAAPVRMEAPAPPRTAPVCALRATAAPTADEVKKHSTHIHSHITPRTYSADATVAAVQWSKGINNENSNTTI